MSNINLQKGHLLIAEPSIIGDLSFNRSIILIADHNPEGSIGFILNKPLDFTLQDLIPEIEMPFEVYNGGPVEQDNLYYIHKIPELIPNSIEISDGLYWGGDFQKVTELIKKDQLKKPCKSSMYCSYLSVFITSTFLNTHSARRQILL